MEKHLIAEADESDGSFIHLHPNAAVVTNIDDDHLVHYENNFEKLLNAFITFLDNVPFFGYIVINNDDKNIKKISKVFQENRLNLVSQNLLIFRYNKATIVKVFKISLSLIIIKIKNIPLAFLHPVSIIYTMQLAVLSIEEGIPINTIKKGLKNFSGVGRRYEKHNLNINGSDILLIDDYGHHPIEVLSNLNAVKQEFPSKRVCVIFQPHRFSRTAQLFDEFLNVLKKTKALLCLIYILPGEAHKRNQFRCNSAISQADGA